MWSAGLRHREALLGPPKVNTGPLRRDEGAEAREHQRRAARGYGAVHRIDACRDGQPGGTRTGADTTEESGVSDDTRGGCRPPGATGREAMRDTATTPLSDGERSLAGAASRLAEFYHHVCGPEEGDLCLGRDIAAYRPLYSDAPSYDRGDYVRFGARGVSTAPSPCR